MSRKGCISSNRPLTAYPYDIFKLPRYNKMGLVLAPLGKHYLNVIIKNFRHHVLNSAVRPKIEWLRIVHSVAKFDSKLLLLSFHVYIYNLANL